jgi:hypothetical protein
MFTGLAETWVCKIIFMLPATLTRIIVPCDAPFGVGLAIQLFVNGEWSMVNKKVRFCKYPL